MALPWYTIVVASCTIHAVNCAAEAGFYVGLIRLQSLTLHFTLSDLTNFPNGGKRSVAEHTRPLYCDALKTSFTVLSFAKLASSDLL